MMRTPMLKRHLRDRDKVGHFLGSVVYMGAVVCLTLVNPTLVPGQRPEYLEPQAQGEKAPPSLEWTGEQLPKFVVVRKYFRVLDNCRAMGQGAYTRMLNRLGISKNTVAEQKLLEALVKAKANEKLRVDLTPHLNKDRDSFMQIQYESLRQRVHGLRKIYRELIEELNALGISEQVLDIAVEEMRPGMIMVSSPTPEYEAVEIMREFEIR